MELTLMEKKYALLFIAAITVITILFWIALIKHMNMTKEFKIKCKQQGGVVHVPYARGFRVPECRNPNFTIDLKD